MLALGINLSHDSSAVLVSESGILNCVQEERLNRIKFSYTFPELAIAEVLRLSKIDPKQIDAVAWTAVWPLNKNFMRFLLKGNLHTSVDSLSLAEKARMLLQAGSQIYLALSPKVRRANILQASELLAQRLRDQFGITAPLKRYEHHSCHAASAYYTSGLDPALIVTSDGSGDGCSGSISIGRKGKVLRTVEIPFSAGSIGKIYSQVTQALGFIPNRHEGKITGLAAHGNPKATLNAFRNMMGLTEDGFGICNRSDNWSARGYYIRHPFKAARFILPRIDHFTELSHHHWLCQHIEAVSTDHPPEDVAAGVQAFTEELTCRWIDSVAQVIGPDAFNGHVALAGGLFANVRLNARVAELPWVEQMFVHPGMGDGGLCVGAAYLCLAEKVPIVPTEIPHAYLGSDYSDTQIEVSLRSSGVDYERPNNIEDAVVEELVAGRVVARFAGAMEYGPRALGNRSILCGPGDPSINDWLNKKLNRTEFMPFAPSSIEELAEKYYKNVQKSLHAARFMTVAYEVSDEFAEKCPAVVHIDNTARPQLVNKRNNPSFYRILKNYQKQTGIPAVLNTSFNMHEEPIVASPKDAIRAYQLGHIDCLAIGPVLCRQKDFKK